MFGIGNLSVTDVERNNYPSIVAFNNGPHSSCQVGSAHASGGATQVIGNLTVKNYHGLSNDDEVDRNWLRVTQFLSPSEEAIRLQQTIHSDARDNL